mmetsp:Transcript_103916/g.294418  ORF Transcript_103916/g.294418 Transcript_103916/m.294418 type:complete len:522 (+) Transcript_103916:537-2102(+)
MCSALAAAAALPFWSGRPHAVSFSATTGSTCGLAGCQRKTASFPCMSLRASKESLWVLTRKDSFCPTDPSTRRCLLSMIDSWSFFFLGSGERWYRVGGGIRPHLGTMKRNLGVLGVLLDRPFLSGERPAGPSASGACGPPRAAHCGAPSSEHVSTKETRFLGGLSGGASTDAHCCACALPADVTFTELWPASPSLDLSDPRRAPVKGSLELPDMRCDLPQLTIPRRAWTQSSIWLAATPWNSTILSSRTIWKPSSRTTMWRTLAAKTCWSLAPLDVVPRLAKYWNRSVHMMTWCVSGLLPVSDRHTMPWYNTSTALPSFTPSATARVWGPPAWSSASGAGPLGSASWPPGVPLPQTLASAVVHSDMSTPGDACNPMLPTPSISKSRPPSVTSTSLMDPTLMDLRSLPPLSPGTACSSRSVKSLTSFVPAGLPPASMSNVPSHSGASPSAAKASPSLGPSTLRKEHTHMSKSPPSSMWMTMGFFESTTCTESFPPAASKRTMSLKMRDPCGTFRSFIALSDS